MKLIYCRPEFLHGIRAIVGCYSPPKIVLQVRHQDWEPSTAAGTDFLKLWIHRKLSSLPSTFLNGKQRWRSCWERNASTGWLWLQKHSPMLLQRRSNGTIGEMRPMASYVSVFPETSFSISMDWLHRIKYGRKFLNSLERQMRWGDIRSKMSWFLWVLVALNPSSYISPSSKH